MPQTIEAINHSKAAEVPIIVAINKCDLATANPAKVKQELTEYGIVAEEWGGEHIMCEVSAKTGDGLDNLRITSYNVCYTKLLRLLMKTKLRN